MKNLFTIIVCFFLSLNQIHSQTINLQDTGGCLVSDEATTNNNDGGSPARNIYTGTANNGVFPFRIIWANNQWEIQFDLDFNGTYEFVVYTNSFASAPNPPELGTGTWTDESGFCGPLTQFEGSGTQTTTALPVELVHFNVKPTDADKVVLEWLTASELNNEGFQVERSRDGRDWEMLDFVKGKGTTELTNNYTYTDKVPVRGYNYYRLKQVDYDGVFEYSEIRTVLMEVKNKLPFRIYPNPVNDIVKVVFDELQEGTTQVRLFNSRGQIIKEKIIDGGDNQMDLSDYPAGMYILKVTNGEQGWQKRIFKQ